MTDESGPAKQPRRRIAPHMHWALPKELRVNEAPMELTVPREPLESLAEAGNLYLRAKSSRSQRAQKPEPSVLVDLAIEAWRLRRRIDQAREGLDARSERALDSSARKLEGVLERAQVEVRDPVGSAYSDGMRSVRALAFEPTAGIAAGERRIIETVTPAVAIGGTVVAAGEVIVGTAIEPETEEKTDA